MIDQLPEHRALPDDVRMRARQTIDEGLSPRPSHRTPVLIAAGVALLAGAAVFAGQFLGGGPAQVASPAPTPTFPQNGEFDPDHRERFHYQAGVVDPDTTARCGAAAQAHPPVKDWTPVATTYLAGSRVSAFRVSQGLFFCTTTSTTVSLSPPVDDTLPAGERVRILFNGPDGQLAGVTSLKINGFSMSKPGAEHFGATVMAADGLIFAPRGFLGAEKGAQHTYDGEQWQIKGVPGPATAVVDRPLPPADRASDAGRRIGECVANRPFADAAQFAPGVDTRLNETATLLVGRFEDRLLVCSGDTTNPSPPYVYDRDELTWFSGESIAGGHVFYNFRKGDQGEFSTSEVALTGLVGKPEVASITYVRPGHQDRAATITGGTFVLTGIPLDTPPDSKVVVRDAGGKILEELTARLPR